MAALVSLYQFPVVVVWHLKVLPLVDGAMFAVEVWLASLRQL